MRRKRMSLRLFFCFVFKELGIRMNSHHALCRGVARMLLAVMLLAGASVLLSACNTTAGAGRDVSDVGHAVTHDAEQSKHAM
jgi:predicted small secreted protein